MSDPDIQKQEVILNEVNNMTLNAFKKTKGRAKIPK